VNTPATITGAADLRYIRKAVGQIGGVVSQTRRRPVLVIKSTSPIGTGETIDAILRRAFARTDHRLPITANPEFLREGSGVHDFFHPDRIVVGGDDQASAASVAALYEGIDAPVILTDLRTALTIAAWGATFKQGSEDLRESPALDIIDLLRNEGAGVNVYDPSLAREGSPSIGDRVCASALEAATDADCVAILTDWPEFAEVDL